MGVSKLRSLCHQWHGTRPARRSGRRIFGRIVGKPVIGDFTTGLCRSIVTGRRTAYSEVGQVGVPKTLPIPERLSRSLVSTKRAPEEPFQNQNLSAQVRDADYTLRWIGSVLTTTFSTSDQIRNRHCRWTNLMHLSGFKERLRRRPCEHRYRVCGSACDACVKGL